MKKLPDSELSVMLAIWSAKKTVHTGEIFESLRGISEWKIQTVQMFLSRLTEKGFLSCEKLGRLNYYTPLVDEAAYREQETSLFVQRLFSGSPKSLIAALVKKSRLSGDDIEDIKRLLEEIER